MIPALNDAEMEDILKACRAAGAESAAYTMLRLPLEVKDLFQEWLAHHEPLKAKRVMGLVRQVRGGKAYNAEFGARMRGSGPVADMIEQRFTLACKRLGFNRAHRELDINQFRPAPGAGIQHLCGGKQLALW
jgi:DNA repair photolyase